MALSPWWRKLTGRDRDQAQVAAPAGPHGVVGRRARTSVDAAPQPAGRPGRRAEPRSDLPVLGVDVAKGGWVGALLEASGHGTPQMFVADSISDLLSHVGAVAVVAIDIPIGLPDESVREADAQTRAFVGPKASSVFTTPVREAIYASTYAGANQINREVLGKGISQQAYGLRRRIMEIDAWVRQDLDFTLVEVHPEASFTELAGAPLLSRKRTGEGAQERREVLASAGVYVPGSPPRGAAPDDMIDACIAAWTAHRYKIGTARSLPEQPQTFSDGLPAAIVI